MSIKQLVKALVLSIVTSHRKYWFDRETDRIQSFLAKHLDSHLRLSSEKAREIEETGQITYASEMLVFKDFNNYVFYKRQFLGEINGNMLAAIIEAEREIRHGNGALLLVHPNEIIRGYTTLRMKEIQHGQVAQTT